MSTLYDMRARLRALKPHAIDESLQRDLKAGWLLPYLIGVDEMGYGRWAHWCAVMEAGADGDAGPIPRIDFGDDMAGVALARRHIEKCLDLVADGGWLGWSSWEHLDYFLRWLLYGFGHSSQSELPREPRKGASMRLYQTFNLAWPMLHPYDILGDLMAECAIGRRAGFYPTPHSVAEMMTRMTFGDEDAQKDARWKTVSDPAMGTGRMLLHASNHSYCLYGQDILDVCVKAALVNGYLFAPWMVKPFPFSGAPAPDAARAGIDAVATPAPVAQPVLQPVLQPALFTLEVLNDPPF
jgi:hypothetical protein